MMDEEVEYLTEILGRACSGHGVSAVLTALTYLLADSCIQSGLGEADFLARFNDNLAETIRDLKEHDNGNCTHH